MELFIPSLLIVFAALIIIAGVLPNLSPFFIATSALILLVYTGYNHKVMFYDQYTQTSWITSIHNSSTPFLITVIVLFSIGWILNLYTGYTPNFFTVSKAVEQPSTTAFYRKFL